MSRTPENPYAYAAKSAEKVRKDLLHCHWSTGAGPLILPTDGPWVDQVRNAIEAAFKEGQRSAQEGLTAVPDLERQSA